MVTDDFSILPGAPPSIIYFFFLKKVVVSGNSIKIIGGLRC